MRKAFLEFLESEGVIPAADADSLDSLFRGAPEPIGSIAFRYGMITGADIDTILDEQRGTRARFGEIAMKLGILTQPQVDALLHVQRMRAATEIAEALALSGRASIDGVLACLSRFFSRILQSPIH